MTTAHVTCPSLPVGITLIDVTEAMPAGVTMLPFTGARHLRQMLRRTAVPAQPFVLDMTDCLIDHDIVQMIARSHNELRTRDGRIALAVIADFTVMLNVLQQVHRVQLHPKRPADVHAGRNPMVARRRMRA